MISTGLVEHVSNVFFMSRAIFLRQEAKKHMKASTLRYFLYPSSRKTQQTKTCLVLKCLSKIPATSFPLLSKCLQSSPTSNYLTKRARWPLRVCRLLPNNFNLSSVASTSLCPRLIMVLKHVGGSSNIMPFFLSKDTPLKGKSTKHLFLWKLRVVYSNVQDKPKSCWRMIEGYFF